MMHPSTKRKIRLSAGVAVALIAALYFANVGNIRKGATVKPGAQAPQASQVEDVDPVAAKALIDAGAMVIDVRDSEPFRRKHVAGASLVPLDELKKEIPATLLKEKRKSIVVTGTNGVLLSRDATALLNDQGFDKAVNLKGGVDAWEAAGFSVERE